MGLSLLFQKKYEQAYNFLSKISSETCDDYKLWYRIGCGLIEIYHKNLQQNYQKKDNGLFKEIIDQYGLKYSLYSVEKEKQRKDSDMNNIDSAQQYNQLQRQQQQIKIQNQKMIFKQHYRRFLLDKKETQNNRSCFRNCELKCQEMEISTEEQNNELNIPMDNDIIEKISKNEELNFSEQIQYEKNSKQAGIHLSNIFSKNLELKFDEQMKARNQVEGENSAFFLSNQDQKIKGKLSLIILNTNLILLNIKNNQIQQASQILNQLFNTLDLDILSATTEIPVPLLNMLIYINLRLGNTKNALTLLKGRRLLTLNNNKALLEITK
ncbi:hypothetical protein PPERSA_06735 [Pseudocohnilembus persalinus]|uniref:Uncharacterized protein n=1 Tax=Pseudocohnilembus persalinus TaxID=266149 RepID=A0A0V0QSA6_PSEPJ|nr:hypothetical protein PPERSA_06735 [Pseudocohnilembus persalinus]|eukprot:KRX05101.1 hypothetical protein PPERSA_06735 [Pseudocohnilembus persalinus]